MGEPMHVWGKGFMGNLFNFVVNLKLLQEKPKNCS